MSNVRRICPQCGQDSSLDARFCVRCGYDHEAALPARGNSLPAVVGRAALPVLAGVTSLALRAGWRLLLRKLNQRVSAPLSPQGAEASSTQVPARARPMPPQPAEPRRRRVIHIRSTWAVGDAQGVWRQGSAEHTIEIEE
ncbi:zinc ribbon domain-containing protein [Litorilinea aerophila]|uniref:Zinc ribbon domain-containing protein n=1 Tax=Litorilinea aerophila TaxID=1204385 RepID=A0A540VKS8_9CHLR|nr:zinc ribbon domain-containing protein [Litorilinea aerophila]MCC9075042.1 zinc ribbon domain-containing protein [Litorilinea aerophila]OUC07180.1 hypothetical protein RY27_16455 [Litorilinea aerophila]GIV79828.1 MAG: hypothetical protein KatS3mg050_4222 [Litorilinea sp.]